MQWVDVQLDRPQLEWLEPHLVLEVEMVDQRGDVQAGCQIVHAIRYFKLD
jgi:hypothetical protein